MKHLSFPIICFFIIFLSGCSTPRELISLKPQNEKTSWFYGQEFTCDSVFGITIKASFNEIQDPWYTFDVEITNHSNMDFLVDPASMYVVPLNGKSEPTTSEVIHAVDPEVQIAELDKKLSINKSNRKAHVGLALLAAGIDIATGISAVSDNNPRHVHIRTNLFPYALAAGAENRMAASDLNEIRDTWRTTTLRKTNLKSGFSMRGKVLVPVSPEASYIQFVVPVDNELIRLNFMQIKYHL